MQMAVKLIWMFATYMVPTMRKSYELEFVHKVKIFLSSASNVISLESSSDLGFWDYLSQLDTMMPSDTEQRQG